MKKFTLTLCLLCVALFGQKAVAKDIYGFLAGSTSSSLTSLGLYSFDTQSAGNMELVAPLSFQFWGGGFGGGYYYMSLSDDAFGYMPEGLCYYDIENQKPYIPGFTQEYYYCDMTYDYSTSTMYGIATRKYDSQCVPTLVSIDLTTGSTTDIGQFAESVASVACSLYGEMYAMTTDGRLFNVDKTDASLFLVGNTDVKTDIYETRQSLEFDRATDELYWSALAEGQSAILAKVSPKDAVISSRTEVENNSLMLGLHIPFEIAGADAPAKVDNLTLSAEGTSVTLTWTNPTKTFGGSDLADDGLTLITITCNGTVIKSFQNPVKGEQMSFQTDITGATTPAALRFIVHAHNAAGRGEGAAVKALRAGSDFPDAVGNLTLESRDGNASLTWSAPTAGKNGGSLDPTKLTYVVTRDYDGHVFDPVTETSFTDTDITGSYYGSYTVKCVNETGEGPALTSSKIALGTPLAPPYSADLATDQGRAQWLAVDANDDGVTWLFLPNNNAVKYPYNMRSDANDHLMSLPMNLSSGDSYEVSYTIYAKSFFGSSENFRLSLLSADGTETVLEDLQDFSNTEAELRSVPFSVAEDGLYTFSLTALSAKDKWEIQISSFDIRTVVTADLALTELTSPGDLKIDAPVTFTATIVNVGSGAVQGFDILLTAPDGSELASSRFDNTLEAGEQMNAEFSWTPETVGLHSLTATVVAEGDRVEDNNSVSVPVSILGSDDRIIEIGGTSKTPTMFPFGFEGDVIDYSYAQTIYRADALGISSGKIKEIRYRYNNSGAPVKRHLAVYLCNSTQTGVGYTWADHTDHTLVYDNDEVLFDEGENMLRLPIETPFEYTGAGLMVTTLKIGDTDGGKIHFYADEDTDADGTPRTIIYQGSVPEVQTDALQYSSFLTNISMIVGSAIQYVADATGNDFGPEITVVGDRLTVSGGTSTIIICDLAGKIAARTVADSISLSTLPAGIYIATVTGDCGSRSVRIAVK